jgi:glutamine synthetase
LEGALETMRTDSDYLKGCFDSELLEAYIMLKNNEIKQIGRDKSRAKQFMLYYDI